MIRIIGDGVIPEAAAFYDVRDALSFDRPVTLAAHVAPLFGLELRDQVIYNLEPLYDGCRSFSVGYLDTLKRCTVLDYSARNVSYLKTLGIEAFHMPYGYHASLERSRNEKKDIDILCLGSINPRRAKIFERLRSDFNFVWAQGVYGEQRDRLIARAKVHVNVHYADEHPLEVVRLNYLMANHGTVVSERGNEPDVNLAYEDGVIFSEYDGIGEACQRALDQSKDGYGCIKLIPHDCGSAQVWLNSKTRRSCRALDAASGV